MEPTRVTSPFWPLRGAAGGFAGAQLLCLLFVDPAGSLAYRFVLHLVSGLWGAAFGSVVGAWIGSWLDARRRELFWVQVRLVLGLLAAVTLVHLFLLCTY